MQIPPVHIAGNISGIFNYCSRWCERCPFTEQCANFQLLDELDELEELVDQDNEPVAQIMRQLPTHLDQVIAELKLHCEKADYEWASIHCDLHEYLPKIGELAKKELAPAARNFTFQLFRLSDMMEEQPMPDSWKNPIKVLRWYGTLLSGKVNRATGSGDDSWLDDDNKAPILVNSDENGSAKLSLLSIIRCLGAVTVMLREPGPYEEELITLVLDLLRLQQGMRVNFPQTGSFERPGFDDPEYFDDMMAFYGGYLPIDPFRDGPWVAKGGRAPEEMLPLCVSTL